MVAYRRKWWCHRCNQSVRATYRQRGGAWWRKESRFSSGPLVSMHVILSPSQINWSIHINAVYLQSINMSWVKFGWCNRAAFSQYGNVLVLRIRLFCPQFKTKTHSNRLGGCCPSFWKASYEATGVKLKGCQACTVLGESVKPQIREGLLLGRLQ